MATVMSYKTSIKTIHEYKVCVLGPKGHYYVKNSTFSGDDENEVYQQATNRIREIIKNKEFGNLDKHPTFDIVIDHIMKVITGTKYSLKNGELEI